MRVLIIDDDPHVAYALGRALRGHEVTVAASGAQGAARCLAEDFDVVVCDLTMPDVDGIEVYERTVRDRPAMGPRFVFVTGGSLVPYAGEFLARTGNRCIPKPFGVEQLRRAVDEVGKAGRATGARSGD